MNAGLTLAEQSCMSCRKGEHGCDERQMFCQCRKQDHVLRGVQAGVDYLDNVTRERTLTPDDEQAIHDLIEAPADDPLTLF